MAEELIEEILWTDNAKASFNNIIEYLNRGGRIEKLNDL